jgi:multidrug transporter EmrE-like cation transporter
VRAGAIEGAASEAAGWLEARFLLDASRVRLSFAPALGPASGALIAAVRRWLDLDAAPEAIDAALAELPGAPGLRLPGSVDGFELAVRAVLGQQVTVAGSANAGPASRRALRHRRRDALARGEPRLSGTGGARLGIDRTESPSWASFRSRAGAIQALAQNWSTLAPLLARGADPEALVERLRDLPGIGAWTAHYVAMRALGWPDAFPPGDVAALKAMQRLFATATRARPMPARPPGGRGAATPCCACGIRFLPEIDMSYATDTFPARCTAQMRYRSPLGPLLLVRTKKGLAGAWFEAQKHHPAPIDAPVDDDDPAAAARGDAARGLLRRRDDPLRPAARPGRHAVPGGGVARAADNRARSHLHLRRYRQEARQSDRRASGRRGGRPQPGLGDRALPPRRRQRRQPHGLCRRPGAQDRPAPARGGGRTPFRLAPARTTAGAALRPRDVVELIALAAVWGGSFLFMRIAVPEFGPVAIAALRVAGASLLLLPLLAAHRELGALRTHWRPIAVLGLTNSALPFFGFAYAAISMDSGVLAIFNSAAPLFAAVIAALWLGDRMTPARIAGLAIGFAGIVWIVAYKSGLHAGGTPLAVVACLVATLLLRPLAERDEAASDGRAAARRGHGQPARRRGPAGAAGRARLAGEAAGPAGLARGRGAGVRLHRPCPGDVLPA